MLATEIEEALDRCIGEVLTRRMTARECVDCYPALAPQLDPLLRTAEMLAAASPVENDGSRARVWRVIEPEIARKPSPLRGLLRGFPFSPTLARAAAAIVVVLAVSLAAVQVSASELPGSPLYPVKRGVELVQLSLALSPDSQGEMRVNLFQRRMDELMAMSVTHGRVDAGFVAGMPDELSSTIDYLSQLPPAKRAALARLIRRTVQQQEPALLRIGEAEDGQVRASIQQLITVAERARQLAGEEAPGPRNGNGPHGPSAPGPHAVGGHGPSQPRGEAPGVQDRQEIRTQQQGEDASGECRDPEIGWQIQSQLEFRWREIRMRGDAGQEQHSTRQHEGWSDEDAKPDHEMERVSPTPGSTPTSPEDEAGEEPARGEPEPGFNHNQQLEQEQSREQEQHQYLERQEGEDAGPSAPQATPVTEVELQDCDPMESESSSGEGMHAQPANEPSQPVDGYDSDDRYENESQFRAGEPAPAETGKAASEERSRTAK